MRYKITGWRNIINRIDQEHERPLCGQPRVLESRPVDSSYDEDDDNNINKHLLTYLLIAQRPKDLLSRFSLLCYKALTTKIPTFESK